MRRCDGHASGVDSGLASPHARAGVEFREGWMDFSNRFRHPGIPDYADQRSSLPTGAGEERRGISIEGPRSLAGGQAHGG